MFTAFALAASAVLSSMSQNSAAKAQSKQAASVNKQQLLSAAQDVSALNVQAGQLAQDATQKRAEAVRLANQASGEQSAMAGATGTRGASVDAVQSDIQMQLGEQEDQINQNFQNDMYSIQQQRSTAFNRARSQMQSGQAGVSIGGTLAGLGSSLLSAYASGLFRRGSTSGNAATNYR